MALRIAFFYACGQFSGTISGLLAYGVSFMNGVCGLEGWRCVIREDLDSGTTDHLTQMAVHS
jgi:hypothetical protein